MKRFFALLMALAMLLPLTLVQPANAADVASQPFIMFNWEEVTEGKYDNIYSAPFFWTAERVGFKISWNGASTPKDLAKKCKDLFDTRPEGGRFIKFAFPASIYLRYNIENYIYMDKGVDMLVPWFEEFLTEFKAIGGQLDGLILDTEITDMGSWYLYGDAKEDPLLYNKIVTDPRYATEVRPLLEERGFPFYENPTEYTPEIYSISRNMTGAKYDEARAIWDRVMRNRIGYYLDECVCQPLWKYYPDALVSDYQSADRAGWHKFLSDTGDNSFGELTASGGNAEKVGNTSNHNVYHSRPSGNFYKDSNGNVVFKNPYSYNDAIYGQTAFNMTLWEINQFKNIYASTDNKKLSAWLTSYNYGSKPLAYSAYTTEIVYHLGMLNPQPFLGYVVSSEVPDVEYYDRLDILSQQIHELTRVAGYSDRKPIEVPANWNDSYLLSGMYANGRNIWRITPDTTQVTLEGFKVAGSDPTFSVGGKTITFPGGKIIEDTKIDAVGSCGYWVETAKDVTPVVTTDAKRYENYPSLFLGFNDSQPGNFDYNTGNPVGAWEIKWNKKVGSTTKIISVNGNNVLAIDGDVTLKSVKLPENITAGDSYAKNQSWDATITIPENMPAEAVVQILTYDGKGQEEEDGGIKVENGKLFYSHNGEFVEMGDIAPGTYIFRRVMDFNNPESFRSSYYVFSDKGSVVAMATNIPTPAFQTITSIGFVTEGVTKAIHLDNFRISVTGIAADFSLYDAKTGIQLKDANTPRSTATAYRLSWLNATDEAQTGKVLAEIYEDGDLKEIKAVKTVVMQPGCDNVETGIVEVGAGQSIKIKLETSYKVTMPKTDTAKPSETVPTAPTDGPTEPTVNNPTVATKAPTQATKPAGSKLTRPTQATEATQATEGTKVPTQATKAPTQATQAPDVTEITAATEVTEETLSPTEETLAPTEPQQTQGTEATDATVPDKTDDTGKKDKGPNVVLIVVIVVVVLAAAGAACWYFFIFKKKPTADVAEEKTEE